jgi:hypothetical protein
MLPATLKSATRMMKLLAIFLVLLAFVVADITHLNHINISSPAAEEDWVKTAVINDPGLLNNPADDVLWNKSVCKGQMLVLAMGLDSPEAGKICQPITSPWDGTLEREFAIWGYSDAGDEKSLEGWCDMGESDHGLQDMLKELGADDRDSMEGGDNICHSIQHINGAAGEKDGSGKRPDEDSDEYYNVNGRRYRVSRYRKFDLFVDPC